MCYYWLTKSSFVFLLKMAPVVLSLCLTQNNFVRLYCDSYHINVYLKKTPKLVNFCAAILILKIEEDKQHFWCIVLYYFNKGKGN